MQVPGSLVRCSKVQSTNWVLSWEHHLCQRKLLSVQKYETNASRNVSNRQLSIHSTWCLVWWRHLTVSWYQSTEDLINFCRSQRGRLSPVGEEPSSHMKLSFSNLSPGVDEDYRVLMTDYTSYAAVWSCKRILFSNQQSGQIMSREPSLNETIVEEIKSRFRFFGIDDRNFLEIDHSNCGDPDDGLERPENVDDKWSHPCSHQSAYSFCFCMFNVYLSLVSY